MSTQFVVDPPASLLPPNYGDWCRSSSRAAQMDSSTTGSTADDIFKVIDLGGKPSKTLPTSVPRPTGPPDVSRLSVKELREACRQQGLKTTGKREELEQRLSAPS